MIRLKIWRSTTTIIAISSVSLLALAHIGVVRAEDDVRPIRALLVVGGCCHDYAKQKDILTQGISARANVVWTIAYDPNTTTTHKNPVYDNPDWAKNFDVVVHDECSSDVKDLEVINGILKPHGEGLPAVVLHCGMHCYRSEGWPKAVTPWFEFTGLQTTAHGAQLPIAIRFVDQQNPITKGLADWTTVKEELYNNITDKLLDTAQVLARGTQPVKNRDAKKTSDDYIVAWTNIYLGKTKVFATTIGHNNETVADARYLDLITRGLLWSVGKLDDAHLQPAKQVLSDERPAARR
jgi:type 1 glutamine amidotransferase